MRFLNASSKKYVDSKKAKLSRFQRGIDLVSGKNDSLDQDFYENQILLQLNGVSMIPDHHLKCRFSLRPMPSIEENFDYLSPIETRLVSNGDETVSSRIVVDFFIIESKIGKSSGAISTA